MPYSTSTSTEECDGVAVVKDSSGEVMGCHDTEEEAQEQIAAIEASENSRAVSDIDLSVPDYMQAAAQASLDAAEDGFIPSSCGTGRGEERARQIAEDRLKPEDFVSRDRGTPIPAYLTSHAEDVTAEGTPSGWAEEEWSDCGNAQYARWGGDASGRAASWARGKANEIAREQDTDIPYPDEDRAMPTDVQQEDTFTLTRSQLEALAPGVAAHLTRAAVEDLSDGDLVRFEVGGQDETTYAYGQIVAIEMDGTIEAEPEGPEMEGTEDNPAYMVQIHRPDDGEWQPTDVFTVHRAGSLEKIDELPAMDDMEEDEGEGGRLLPESVMPDVEKEFKRWENEREKERKAQGEHRSLVGASIRQTGDKREWTVQIMTEDIARDGMILRADGVQTDAYEKNPVVLWNHGMSAHDMPIARCTQLIRKDGAILAKVKFDRSDEFAKEIERKLKDGYINAVSIGWRTEDSSMEEVDGRRVPVVTKADMTEFSFVSVGADAEALAQRKYDGEEDMDRMMKEYKRMYDDLRAHCMERMDKEEMEERGMLDMMRMYMEEELDMPKRMKDDEQEGDMPERSDTSDPATAGSPSNAAERSATAPSSEATDRDEEIVDTYEVDSLDDLWDMIDQIADRKLGRA